MPYAPGSTGFIGHVNHMNAALGLTASSAASNLPAGNLLNDQLSKVWRSKADVLTPTLTLDLGESNNIDVVALVATNLKATSQWRVQLSGGYDSGLIPTGVDEFYGMAVHLLPVSMPGQVVTIDIVAADLPYVQAGRLVVQRVWRFQYGPEASLEEEWVDASTRDQTEDSRLWVYNRPALRRVSGTLNGISEVDYLTRGRIISRNLASKVSTLLCTESHVPTAIGAKSVWGLLERGMPFRVTNRTATQTYYSASFSLMEQA